MPGRYRKEERIEEDGLVWVTTKAAARSLDYDPGHIRTLVVRGDLDARKKSTGLWISLDSINNYRRTRKPRGRPRDSVSGESANKRGEGETEYQREYKRRYRKEIKLGIRKPKKRAKKRAKKTQKSGQKQRAAGASKKAAAKTSRKAGEPRTTAPAAGGRTAQRARKGS